MNNIKDLVGQKFGKLTVISRGEDGVRKDNGKKVITWNCRCDCGNIKKNISSSNLKQGNVRSCGCLRYVSYHYEIGEVINGYQITNRYRKDKKKFYTYKCITCGYENNVPEGRISFNHGCPVCNGRITLKGVNDLWTTDPQVAGMLQNDVDGYKSRYSKEKVNWICPKCSNVIYQKTIWNIVSGGLSCPCCSDGISYPEKMMANILDSLSDIKYFKRNTVQNG